MDDKETTLFNEPKSQEIITNHERSSWELSEALRKKNPREYWSTSFQAKLHKLAQKEKEQFYGNKAN